jgi:uncharacterized protein
MNPVHATDISRTRTWATPRRPWAIRMIWRDLLFAHWPINPHELSDQLPPGLKLDTFDSQAWIGIVPFHMTGIRPHCMPPLPGLSAFPELNLRTYVVADGKPGVWFLSLDATSGVAVRIARRFFHLPYGEARIRCRTTPDGWIDFRSKRVDRHYPPAEFAARYRPLPRQDGARDAGFELDSLSNWLTARFCLYSANHRGQLFRGEINHEVWLLEPAEAIFEANTLTKALGVTLPNCEPLLHFSRRIEAVAWTVEPVM